LGLLFYNLFLILYAAGIRIVALSNSKARKWIRGRKTFPSQQFKQTIWMHCASLGEFEQGRPILEALRERYPNLKTIVTFFSPSGFEVRKNYSGADAVYYLPMDGSMNAKKFIDNIDPAIVLWVKYEYWYYYLQTLKKRKVPVLLVSGLFRPSQPFFKWYGGIWRKMLSCFTHFFLQNKESYDLLDQLQIQSKSVSGDTRFDRVMNIADAKEELPVIKDFCKGHRVLIAGSTWEEDDEELLHYTRIHPEIRFVIAPHEIEKENLNDVLKRFQHAVFYSKLSEGELLKRNQHILIIDNIGMLSRIYRYADITYVGGGFGNDGIHNILEAAVYGKPVIIGPVYEDHFEACELIDAGGGYSIDNALSLEKLLDELFNDSDKLRIASEAARKYIIDNVGATQKILNHIQENRLLTS
jgi:3-deoxy-D-manno-octulosonic-acid transferase